MPMKPSHPLSSGTENETKPPLYQQIYLQIREKITSGDYPDGSLLPTESEAALLFGVSRITVKRAFNELAADGLCVRKRGQGSRVTYKMSATPLKSDFQGLLDVFADMNMNDTEGKVLEFEYIAAGARIAEIFNIEPSAQIQRSVRVLYHERKALSYLTTYVPADLGRQYESLHLVDQPVVTMLEKTGVKVANAEQAITEPWPNRLLQRRFRSSRVHRY